MNLVSQSLQYLNSILYSHISNGTHEARGKVNSTWCWFFFFKKMEHSHSFPTERAHVCTLNLWLNKGHLVNHRIEPRWVGTNILAPTIRTMETIHTSTLIIMRGPNYNDANQYNVLDDIHDILVRLDWDRYVVCRAIIAEHWLGMKTYDDRP